MPSKDTKASVEGAYREALSTWTGTQRVERASRLFSEVREMLVRKILAEEPGLSEHELASRVARHLYRTDREALRLIDLLEA